MDLPSLKWMFANNQRARRVKCDEQKPYCSWCTKIGKQCVYPVNPTDNVDHKQVTRQRLLLPQVAGARLLKLNLVPGSGMEKRSFEFYVVELGDMLTSSFDIAFWKGILIQRSCSEPALWHSLVSLSMFSELRNKDVNGVRAKTTDRSDNLALWHYNKAIQLSTQSVTANDPSASDILLVNSILFTLIELVQVDVARASVHLSSGFRLLERSKAEQQKVQPYQKDFLQELLVPMFSHMRKSKSKLPYVGNSYFNFC